MNLNLENWTIYSLESKKLRQIVARRSKGVAVIIFGLGLYDNHNIIRRRYEYHHFFHFFGPAGLRVSFWIIEFVDFRIRTSRVVKRRRPISGTRYFLFGRIGLSQSILNLPQSKNELFM